MNKEVVTAQSSDGDDPERNRLLPNAALAVLQVVVSSVLLLLLYRYILFAQGVDALGIWSLVVAATSLANIGNFGLAGSTVRFVSKYLARDDAVRAAFAVETSVLSIAAAMGITVILLAPASEWLLSLVVPADSLAAAVELVPYTLAALWLSSLGGAVYSGLDGVHRADRRSLATIATQPLLLLLAIGLVPQYGLKGLAYAQIAQYLVFTGLGWFLLRRQLPTLSVIPWRWSRKLFQEMWRYGLGVQIISILTLLFEPLGKGLLSHYGSLSAVGYFEMANRLVVQVRALLVSANQVLVPYYSKVSEERPEGVRLIYQQNLTGIVLLSSLTISSLVALLPLISNLWIGRLEWQFLLFASILSVGWFVNTIGVPAYFLNLGSGLVARNVYSHLAQTIGIAVLGAAGGVIGGATGCVVAWPLALFLGTIVVVSGLHRAEGISLATVLSMPNISALALGALIAFSSFLSYLIVADKAGLFAAATISIALVVGGLVVFVFLVPGVRSFGATLWRHLQLRS